MSNSSLVTYTKLSPNCSKPRNKPIRKIVIHHMAGKLTVQSCGNVFASTSRQASSNYGIDSNGNVGLYVEEKNRSWCTSNQAVDNEAITIEVANSFVGGNWPVSDKALSKLIELCVDICKRNNISKLNYTGDKSGNLLMHCWYAATSCPGPYLKSKFPYIAQEVNKRLENKNTSTTVNNISNNTSTKKSVEAIAKEVIAGKWGNGNDRKSALTKAGYNYSEIQNEVNMLLGKANTTAPSPYKVQVTVKALNIRSGPGTNYKATGVIRDKGVYTIVSTSGSWGKLKSGAGWICLDYAKKL